MFVKEIVPSIIKNSRNEKTICLKLETYEGRFISSAPSGKSKGKNEVESYNVKGIVKSFYLLKIFCKLLKHKNFIIKDIDGLKKLVSLVKRFEGRYGGLGGNVTYALEGVFLKGAAADTNREVWQFINDDVNNGTKVKIPMPIGNCIGGGLHSKLVKGKRPDFQEFLLIPKEKTFSKAVTTNLRAYHFAKGQLKSRGKNDENAWKTEKTNEEVLEILKVVGKKFKVRIGLDIAASTFYKKGYYYYKNKELIRDKIDQADYVERLVKRFGIYYIEDGMQEGDFSGFKEILGAVNKNVLIVGDDLTTTNLRLVRRAVNSKAMNAMIIKPNQIGSLIQVRDVVKFCKNHEIKLIFSHRSGETMDDILADYCIGFGGDFIKTGIFGKERLIKLKRVMDIEKSLVC
jgi:enolase